MKIREHRWLLLEYVHRSSAQLGCLGFTDGPLQVSQ